MFHEDVAETCLQTEGFSNRMRRAVTILKLSRNTSISDNQYRNAKKVEEAWLLRSGVFETPITESDLEDALKWLKNAV